MLDFLFLCYIRVLESGITHAFHLHQIEDVNLSYWQLPNLSESEVRTDSGCGFGRPGWQCGRGTGRFFGGAELRTMILHAATAGPGSPPGFQVAIQNEVTPSVEFIRGSRSDLKQEPL